MVEYTVRRSGPLSRVQAAIGWATLAVVLVSVLFHGANSPVVWTPFAFIVAGLFALQLCLGFVRGVPMCAYKLQGPALLYLVALTWGILQTLPLLPPSWGHPFWSFAPKAPSIVSATPIAGQHAVLKLTTYAMVFWIAMLASMNATRAFAFLRAFALFSLALAAFGLFAAISGINPILGEQATAVVSATFVNRNSYATYAVFGLIANLGVYLRCVRPLNETTQKNHNHALRIHIEKFFSGAWIYALGAALCLSALLLTTSRAGFGTALVALPVFIATFLRGRGGSKTVWLSLIVFFGAIATALSESLVARLSLTTSIDHRLLIYREIIGNLDDRLFVGHGLGAFEDTFRPFVPMATAAKEWSHAHNTFLEALWEMGLPAALAFYAALAWVALVILRGSLVRQRNRLYPTVALSIIVAGGLHSLVDFSLQMPATAALFAFVLGVGWAHAWPSRRRDNHDPAS